MSKQKRVAAFYHSETRRDGFVPVAVGDGLVAYVRGEVLPKGTTLIGALGKATAEPGENFMNGHYVSGAPSRTHRRDAGIIRLARAAYHRDGEVEVDSNALLSEGADNGTYVQAWVWVSFTGTRFDKEKI